MDPKEKEDLESLVKARELLSKLQQHIEKGTSGSSADFQNLSKEIQLHLMKTAAPAQVPNNSEPNKATSHIKDGYNLISFFFSSQQPYIVLFQYLSIRLSLYEYVVN